MADNQDDTLVDPDDQDIDGAVAALGGDDAADTAPADAASDTSYDDVFEDTPDPGDQPRGPDGRFLPKEETPQAPAPTAGASAAPPAGPLGAPPPAPPPDPYADWQPFPFKADGVEATIDGIRANETHIVIPRAVWDSEFRPKHLANREAWQQERQQWQQRIQQAEGYAQQAVQEHAERVHRADAIVAQFNDLIANPDKFAAFLDDFERQAPILQARIDADVARKESAQLKAAQQREVQQAEYDRLITQSADLFEQDVTALLKDAKYAGLATSDDERNELLMELWDPQLILIPDRDYPEYGLRRGVPAVNRDAVTQLLDRRAAFLARRQSTWQQTAHAEARNAAAVASPATTPRTVPAAKPGPRTPAPPARRPPSQPAPLSRRITDEDREAWEKDYASVFDE